MPELPEVETSRRGITPHIQGQIFKHIIVRQPQLRWPIPETLTTILPGLKLEGVNRRGKYLLLSTAQGTLILHLGMSGNLRITQPEQPLLKHDHIDFVFTNDTVLRFNDQRRFGAVLWTDNPIQQHPLFIKLGPEPLSDEFDADYLLTRCQNRRSSIKNLIMDSQVVVGVGNIYASETLFLAGIHPNRLAGEIDFAACQGLVAAIKTVLQSAIDQGGTTLRDFLNAQGKPGYFQQSLSVYGREGEDCLNCAEPIRQLKIGQRSSYFCNSCQR